MSKTNIIILGIVAVVAAIFVYNYIQPPSQTWGASDKTVSQQEVREIMLLEAIDLNITVSDRELKSAYLGLLNKSEMSNESYEQYIVEKHGSRDRYDQYLKENLIVLKLINDQVNWSKIKIDDATIDAYIAENSAIFPKEQLADPAFKEQLYSVARKQMFERQRQALINEYVSNLVKEKTADSN